MEEKCYLSLMNLKKTLKEDTRIIELSKLEKEMEEDEEVQLLSYKKDILSTEYSDLLKIYDENNELVINKRKQLYLAKKELESHIKVRNYLKKYQEVRELLDEINNILFNDFKINLCN